MKIFTKVLILAVVVVAFVGTGGVWFYLQATPSAALPPPSPSVNSTTTPAPLAPTIGTTTANPTIIAVNTPTVVTVTSVITDPTVIPTGVNLLRLNPNGSSTVIGLLKDDGTNGDAIAGDKIFSIQTNFTPSSSEQIRLQISAAFRGVLKRVLSNVILITTIDGPLPPDPGDAGKVTLGGIDSDRNGVRDDIQRYIALTYPDNAKIRAVLTQFTTSEQQFLLNADNKQASINTARMQSRALACLSYVRPTDGDSFYDALRPQILNTKERSIAYIRADAQLSGQGFPIFPRDQRKAQCDFDPDKLPN